VQELFDNMQAFPLMEYSWRPYEDLCLEEFLARLSSFRTAEDVDQLVQPFDTMLFLQARGQLKAEFLQALNQWCLRGVHRPNVLSERRPTTKQLVKLHDRCWELGLEDQALQDAIQFFVESAGGRWPSLYPQPLKYKKRRKYIRSADPLAGLQLPPLSDMPLALPGLPSGQLDIFSEDVLVPAPVSMGARRGIKPSARSPELSPEESTVRCWVTTRKGPRPRRPRDPGLKKYLRKDMPRAPLWLTGGWEMRPKYQPGQKLGRYPYAGVPVGKRGAAWVLRR